VPSIEVIKRDGSKEPLNLEKLHKMTFEACEGLSGVSASQIEMNSGIQVFNGISTKDIQDILVRSAADLIALETPNYQYAAARLLLFALRKEVMGQFDYVSLSELISRNIKNKVYDDAIVTWYSVKEIEKLDSYIKHSRDLEFTYAGLRQIVDKYLVQDRSNGQVFETPQFMYMMIAATMFYNYPKDVRLSYVKRYYDAISTFKINIPTPVMAGVRTPIRQFASCVLVDADDTINSIFSSDMAIGYYTSQRAGIGINAGRIRAINSKIRGGEVQHTGVIPFLKKFEATVRCCTQNGVRGGSATVHFPIWHKEIEDILVLKNNKGTEDNRVRKLDYSIQISKLFYERFIEDKNISLFSPNDVPGLYEAFGTPKFDDLYRKYERAHSIPKIKVKAQEIFMSLLKERAETGRIYIMNIDHCNEHSSFLDKIYMSNLCQEITLPTKPISHIDDENGEIALCILSAINLGKIKDLDDLDELSDIAVRALDELIDFQGYPVRAAEKSTKARRSLGVGYIGVAHYLAKNKVKYDDPRAWQLMHDTTEALQY
jgi:ribonucleoside-diphosphate reductase alpha chain